MNRKVNTVLVIDDDEINLVVAKVVLERTWQCQVITVTNALEGIAIMQRQPITVVLLDIEMPDIDGFETLAEIRKDPRLRNIPVIMLTAAADRDTVARVMQQGVEGYIRKPFLPEKLAEQVGKFLRLGENAFTVLLVDDDDELRTILGNWIINALPYHVLKADCAVSAMEQMKSHHVHLLLLDVSLPDWDGFRLLDILGMKSEAEEMRVLLMPETDEEEEMAQEAGSELLAGYIRKPLEQAVLLEKLVEIARQIGQKMDSTSYSSLHAETADNQSSKVNLKV